MIKHIVIWRMKKGAAGASHNENAAKLKQRIEALPESISEIRHIEVGIHKGGAQPTTDVALYSEFADWTALEAYQQHPAHQEVVAFVRAVTEDRRVVDYEC